MSEARYPIKYLGVSIGMKRLSLPSFNPLLEKIRNKLASWKGSALSFAGNSTLIQLVLQSILVYLMSSGWVPKTVLEKIDVYCRTFIWSKDGESRGIALAAWDTPCRSKEDGGFRLQILER